jgi:hypothetical protein
VKDSTMMVSHLDCGICQGTLGTGSGPFFVITIGDHGRSGAADGLDGPI